MAVLGNLLFYSGNRAALDDVLRHQASEGLRAKAEQLPASAFSKTDAELSKEIVDQVRVNPLRVDFDQAKPSVAETTVEMAGDDYGFRAAGNVPGLRVTKAIPFKGDAQLWRLQPNPNDLNPPRGSVEGNRVVVGVEIPTHQSDMAASYLDETIGKIKTYLQYQEAQIAAHNAQLETTALAYVHSRRSRVGTAADLLKKIGGS